MRYLAYILTGALAVSGCKAFGLIPKNPNTPVDQAAMANHKHILTDNHGHKNIGLGIQPRDVTSDEAAMEADVETEDILDARNVYSNCAKMDNCTVTTSSAATPSATICHTCTRFTTLTATRYIGVDPAPTAPPGKDEEPCHGDDKDTPKCFRKRMPEPKGAHNDDHDGHDANPYQLSPNPAKNHNQLYDEHGNPIKKRPKTTKPPDRGIELWSEEDYDGYRVIYGTFDKCDTVQALTKDKWGFGQSVHVRYKNTCCQLFARRGCTGGFMMLADDVPSLTPYGFAKTVKSVLCMLPDQCREYYANNKWRDYEF